MAETGFKHRLTALKIVGHFFGLSYMKISGSNQVKNSFVRIRNISVPCPHAQLRGGTVVKKLWIFFGPWGRDRSQSPPCWICRVKQIHQYTASERTTRQTYPLCWKGQSVFSNQENVSNVYPLEVVSRYRDPQLQGGKHYSHFLDLRTHCHFQLFMFKLSFHSKWRWFKLVIMLIKHIFKRL